jgi:hypothetical protein
MVNARTIRLISLFLVLALGTLDGGFALWSDGLQVEGTVETGDVGARVQFPDPVLPVQRERVPPTIDEQVCPETIASGSPAASTECLTVDQSPYQWPANPIGVAERSHRCNQPL